jgi:hypothetical protein
MTRKRRPDSSLFHRPASRSADAFSKSHSIGLAREVRIKGARGAACGMADRGLAAELSSSRDAMLKHWPRIADNFTEKLARLSNIAESFY